jgi:ML-like domain
MFGHFKVNNVVLSTVLFISLPVRVLGGDVLQTNGFTSCGSDADIQVQKMNITYNKATQLVDFDVAGTSNQVQEVSNITPYSSFLLIFATG